MKKLKSILRPFLGTLTAWWYNLSSWTYKAIVGPFMCQIAVLLSALFILLGIGGCSTVKHVKYVPIQTEERVEVRDSIVYVRDTVEIPIERQIIKEIIPSVDTSYLSTDLARSTAYLDTLERKIHHTLEQRGTIKAKIDTFYLTKIEEKTVYKDRPVEVEIPVKYVPSFYKFCLWWFIGCVILIALWIVMKLKP